MKPKVTAFFAALLFTTVPALAVTNDLATALQQGLFEEEANHNLGAAIQAYQSIAAQFDKDRKLAATAIFRLGECYRKEGKTNEANAQYQRVLREFPDQQTLVTVSRQILGEVGNTTTQNEARHQQGELLQKQIKLAEQDQAEVQKQVDLGRATQSDLRAAEQVVLRLRAQLAALDAGQPVTVTMEGMNQKDRQRALESAQQVREQSAKQAEDAEIQRLQAMIKDNPDLINARGGNGKTPLHYAVKAKQPAVVQFLLSNGADTEVEDDSGMTLLYTAVDVGDKDIVELLIAKGAKVQSSGPRGKTALHLAAEKGFRAIAELLLQHGADVNARDRDHGSTPLHFAVAGGFKTVAELLLDHGADVNAAAQMFHLAGVFQSATPLHVAVGMGYQSLAELLLAHGADVNAANSNGNTPLHIAAQKGSLPMATLLLSKGADVNAQGPPQLGWTPLASAIEAKQVEMVTFLLGKKADPNTRFSLNSVGGYTPLLLAIAYGCPSIVEPLLNAKAGPNARSNDGELPIFKVNSCSLPQTERNRLIGLLLDHGAEVDATNVIQRLTLLMMAADRGNKDLVKLLLAHKANPNARSSNGQTPLHFAVEGRHKAVVELLLANGADVNAVDNDGKTPLATLQPLLAARESAAHGAQSQRLRAVGSSSESSDPLATPLTVVELSLSPTGSPSESSEPQATPAELAEVLRQHGAVEQMPDFTTIRLTRKGLDQPIVVFRKDTNGLNRFTLVEAIRNYYEVPVPYVPGQGAPVFGTSGGMPIRPMMLAATTGGKFPFPDLRNILIHRPIPRKPGEEKVIAVALPSSTNSIACEKNVPLEFGDVVEIPEREHSLAEPGVGLTMQQEKELEACLARKVAFVAKGERAEVTLSGVQDAFLSTALKTTSVQAFLRSSSDLTRVRVTRTDPATKKTQTFTEDVRSFWNGKQPSWNDLWLRDGDVVEVPEKP